MDKSAAPSFGAPLVLFWNRALAAWSFRKMLIKNSRKVLTSMKFSDNIIFADAIRKHNAKVQKATVFQRKNGESNLDNWTVKQPWKIKKHFLNQENSKEFKYGFQTTRFNSWNDVSERNTAGRKTGKEIEQDSVEGTGCRSGLGLTQRRLAQPVKREQNSDDWTIITWEFDPGSGWTLAACLTHASRTKHLSRWMEQLAGKGINWGDWVADGWVTRG